MSRVALVISPIAKKDLKGIYEFGKSKWGREQSNKYLETVKNKMLQIFEYPNSGRDRMEISLGIKSLSVGSHIIYYRANNNSIEVVRVLHRRQEPINYNFSSHL